MGEEQRQPEQGARLSERERTKTRDRFGRVLVLLILAVFFSIAAPDGLWAWLATTIVLAANLRTAMLASGAQPRIVRAWSVFAGLGVGASVFIAFTQATRFAGGYLALATLLLTLVTMGAIARRLWLHADISVVTVPRLWPFSSEMMGSAGTLKLERCVKSSRF